MPTIDRHAAVSTLRARWGLARRSLEQEAPAVRPAALAALDALQDCLESLSPSTLSCTAWQSLALTAWRTIFPAGSPTGRLYAGGLLVFCHSTGINWSGAWKDELLDTA
jgi:hypothetical protein